MLLAEPMVWRSFRGASGVVEHYIAITASDLPSFSRQMDAMARRYAESLETLGLDPATAVFRRFYLSDAANQAAGLQASRLFAEPADSPVATSIVQQPPLPGGQLALLAYHIDDGTKLAKREIAPGHMLLQRHGLDHLWSTRLCMGAAQAPVPAGAQTRDVFDALIRVLSANGATLAENCLRTWIYVKDVDVFYNEMAAARSDLFARHGLTPQTHYLASTGIEGACAHRYDVVLMDAYSILGVMPAQIDYLNDFSRLCATKDYGITFERATRIGYADRAHVLISGTASIDHAGQVVHVGDVERQLRRALDNVAGLLRAGGAGLDALRHLIVYLRDPADERRIGAAIAERFPDLPCLILRGAVCRPEWLVEVEGVACMHQHAPTLPPF